MKFTKEDAHKELVGKMTAKGEKLNLSERSISEQLDTLIPLIANEETELADFIDKVLPVFKTADANVRNDVSVGIRAYEDKNPKQEPTKQNTETGESELEKRLKAMEEKLAKSESEKRVASIRGEVLGKLKEKGIEDVEWCDKLLSLVSFDDNYDVEANVESYVALYNQQESITGKRTPRGAGGGDGEKTLKNFISEAKAYAVANDLK
jgi:hypothetical protein